MRTYTKNKALNLGQALMALSRVLSLSLGFFLTACDQPLSPPLSPPSSPESSKAASPPPEITVTETPTWPEEAPILYEDYNDPAQWAEPRLQFIASSRENGAAIWSIKPDGSDKRLAFNFRTIIRPEDGDGSAHVPARSPNNRYLALTLDGGTGVEGFNNLRAIVNLTEQRYEVIDTGIWMPLFIWSEDSKKVYFYSSSKFKMYNLETKKLTQLSDRVKSDKLYMLKNQTSVLSVLSAHLSTYSLETGKEIKHRVNLKPTLKFSEKLIENVNGSDLSPDQQHLSFRNVYSRGVVNIHTGKVLFYGFHEDEPKVGDMTSPVFLNNKELIYGSGKDFYKMNIFTEKRTKIPNTYYHSGRFFRLINKQTVK